MQDFISIMSTFGMPTFLVMYYLFVQVPRQERKANEMNERYTNLINRVTDVLEKNTIAITTFLNGKQN